MGKLESPKVCAALVIVAWLATLVSSWGMEAAGRDAVVGDRSCGSKDLQSIAIQLEMASTLADVEKTFRGKPASPISVRKAIDRGLARSPKEAMDLLNTNQDRSACIRRGEVAKIWADFRFIPAYSALTFFLFLFVVSLRDEQPARRRAFLGLGAVLAVAMFLGDIFENFRLFSLIELAAKTPRPADLTQQVADQLDLLRVPSFLKMGALALSAVVLAGLWSCRPSPRLRNLVWMPRLLGVSAAGLVAYGLVRMQSQPVIYGMLAFFFFWLFGLVHAVAVAVSPEPSEGGPQS